MKVSVIGAAGYVGGELLRILLQHPEVTECIATSRSHPGATIATVHPALGTLTDARFAGHSPADAARGRDVVFSVLEHGEFGRIAEAVFDAGPGLIVDLAPDFRVADLTLYEKHYGSHPAPSLLGRFSYALADVTGSRLRGQRALAVPGCFATAAQLALYPLAKSGLTGTPALFAITGSSGSGVQPKSTTHHPTRAHNVFAYSVLGHRHEAEVLLRWREWTGNPNAVVRLLTHSGPFVRGIYLTLHAIRATEATAPRDVAALYREAYAGRPFVRVLGQPPELTHAVGTNHALIHAVASPDLSEVQVMVAVDNLIKGAGGQAVQAMNLALGLAEDAGLKFTGMFPC